MEKITIVINKEIDRDVEHVIIEHADGSCTSMSKAHYDEQKAAQVEHLTEIVPASD